MDRIYYLILLYVLPLTLASQTGQSTNNIFNRFTIGQTDTGIVTQLTQELGHGYSTALTCDPLSGIRPDYFVEFVTDSNKLDHQCEGYAVPAVRHFCLGFYVAEVDTIRGLSLTFYKDTLIGISCEMSSSIEGLMNLRFGSYYTAKGDNEWPCYTSITNEVINVTTTEVTRWWTKKGSAIGVYSDSLSVPNAGDCREVVTSNNFYVRNIDAMKIVDLIQNEMHFRYLKRKRMASQNITPKVR